LARKRCVVVYVAVSADGYIARPDGAVEWLDRPGPAGDYGMRAFLRSIDTILWGRKTYEMALGFGEKATQFGPGVRSYVFTRGPLRGVAPPFELVREPMADFVRRLRAEPGRDIWVMGGADLIGSLVDAGEVDAFVVHVIPTLIGAGIPLLRPGDRLVPLKLKAVRAYADGVLRVHYLVDRAAAVAPGAGAVAPGRAGAVAPAPGAGAGAQAPEAQAPSRAGRRRRRGPGRAATEPTQPASSRRPGSRRRARR
jgi:dihydrofolate reductase